MFGFLSSRLAQFERDDRGAVALIFALSCIVLLALIGLAVDNARYQNLASRLQQSLDGASLAAAKMLSEPGVSDGDIAERATAFYQASVQTYGVEPTSISPLTVNIDRTASSVEVLGRVQVPSLFGGFAGMPSVNLINQKARVIYDITSVELAMVLDITGSMNNKGKLNDLKMAATDVIDTLFDGALNDNNVRIAVAPYSASVNAGEYANDVTTLPVSTSCYKPCWWCALVCTDVTGTLTDTCVLERQGGEAYTDAAPGGINKLPNVSTLGSTPAKYVCPSASVIPLSGRANRDGLKNAINSYVAAGATAGHIGTAWGMYLLSPNWASIFPPDSAPKPFGAANVQKAMIVMTDGEFNTSYTGAADEAAESYSYFDNLCASAKANGITVYTVGFDLNLPDALAHLEACASSAANFYDAKTGAQLKDAFKDIANKLGNLRVAG